MPATSFDHVEVTGLTSSGTTTNAGNWQAADVDLGSFITVPSGATAAIILLVNRNSSQRWAGIRTGGKTAPVVLVDQSADDSITVIVPLGTGNTVNFYAESVSSIGVKFYILGTLGSEWTWFDIDGTAVTLTSTASAWASRTVSELPSGTQTIVMPNGGARWRPTGETNDYTTGSGFKLVKVDASKAFDLLSTVDERVQGYSSSGVTWEAWGGNSLSYTADGTWRTGQTNSGKAIAHLQHVESLGSLTYAYRQAGSTWDLNRTNNFSEAMYAPLSEAGTFEYNMESTYAATVYVLAWLDAASSGPSVTAVNTDEALSPGETATITGTGFGATQGAGGVKLTQEAGALESALTGITWGGDTSITGTVALGGLSYGATTSLVVTDDAAATGSIAVTFPPATGYAAVTLSGYPGTGYVIGEDASPAVVDGDQVEYESTASSGAGVTVNADGTFVLDTVDPATFSYRVRDNTDNTWSSWGTIRVNMGSGSLIRNGIAIGIGV